MGTLYEITGDYLRLLEMLESEETIDSKTFADTLEGIEGELEAKADGYARVIKELHAEARKYEEEIKRMTKRMDTLNNRSKLLKQKLYESMKATNKRNFKTELFSFKIQKNGGLQPVELLPDKVVPDEYCKKEPDKKKIREELETGKELSFAVLKERGESLVIR